MAHPCTSREVVTTSDDTSKEWFAMKNRQRRELLVIEKNLLAESPEMAALFAPLVRLERRARIRRAAPLLAACLLPFAAFLDDTMVLLGALALLSMSAVRWTV